jgi:hypothetical protein
MPVNTVSMARRGAFSFAGWHMLLPFLVGEGGIAVDLDVFGRMRCTCSGWRRLLTDVQHVSVHLQGGGPVQFARLQRYSAFRNVLLTAVQLPEQLLQEKVVRNVTVRNAYVSLPGIEDYLQCMYSCLCCLYLTRVINVKVGSIAHVYNLSADTTTCRHFLYAFASKAAALTIQRSAAMTTFFFADIKSWVDVRSVLLLARALSLFTVSYTKKLAVRVHFAGPDADSVSHKRSPIQVFTEEDFTSVNARQKMHSEVTHGWNQHRITDGSRFELAVSLCMRGSFESAEPFDPFPRLLHM